VTYNFRCYLTCGLAGNIATALATLYRWCIVQCIPTKCKARSVYVSKTLLKILLTSGMNSLFVTISCSGVGAGVKTNPQMFWFVKHLGKNSKLWAMKFRHF